LQLDLQLQDEAGGDISSFITNGEWDLLGECRQFQESDTLLNVIWCVHLRPMIVKHDLLIRKLIFSSLLHPLISYVILKKPLVQTIPNSKPTQPN